MSYVIWMVVLTVIAVILFTAKRNVPEIRDYRQSWVLYLAGLLKPAGFLILGLMAFRARKTINGRVIGGGLVGGCSSSLRETDEA